MNLIVNENNTPTQWRVELFNMLTQVEDQEDMELCYLALAFQNTHKDQIERSGLTDVSEKASPVNCWDTWKKA